MTVSSLRRPPRHPSIPQKPPAAGGSRKPPRASGRAKPPAREPDAGSLFEELAVKPLAKKWGLPAFVVRPIAWAMVLFEDPSK